MEPKFVKLPIFVGDVTLRVAQGHFATRHSHINYFIDVTSQRSSLREAEAVARELSQSQLAHTTIDTILCMDGTRVIGTCLAQQLANVGYRAINSGKDIYLLRDNLSSGNQLIFRENARFMLEGKNVLLLLASITTGGHAEKGMRCVRYYGGQVAGVAAIYSHVTELDGVPVTSLFHTENLAGYASYSPEDCPLCKQGREVDAVVDQFGYSSI